MGALGQNDALVGAASSLQPHEELAAFFHDVYVITMSRGARRVLDTVTGAIAAHCGIAANLGNTQVLLARRAAPRASHALRSTVPPSLAAPYAEARDAALWNEGLAYARAVAARLRGFLPRLIGRVGLMRSRSDRRVVPVSRKHGSPSSFPRRTGQALPGCKKQAARAWLQAEGWAIVVFLCKTCWREPGRTDGSSRPASACGLPPTLATPLPGRRRHVRRPRGTARAACARGVRLGRMVGLQKPDGGVRGLVMSDVFGRVVARTLAQQHAGAF